MHLILTLLWVTTFFQFKVLKLDLCICRVLSRATFIRNFIDYYYFHVKLFPLLKEQITESLVAATTYEYVQDLCFWLHRPISRLRASPLEWSHFWNDFHTQIDIERVIWDTRYQPGNSSFIVEQVFLYFVPCTFDVIHWVKKLSRMFLWSSFLFLASFSFPAKFSKLTMSKRAENIFSSEIVKN